MQYQTVIPHHDVRAVFERVVQEVREQQRHRVVSISFPAPEVDPVDVFAAAHARGATAMLWQLPAKGVALVGVGAERELSASGPERFADIGRQWRELVAEAIVIEGHSAAGGDAAQWAEPGMIARNEGAAPHPGPGPVAMGGFAFAPGGSAGPWEGFGDGWVCLPRTIYGVAKGLSWVTINAVVTAETDPDEAVRIVERERQRAAAAGDRSRTEVAATVADEPSRPNGKRASVRAAVMIDPPTSDLVASDLPSKERWMAAVKRVAGNIRAGRLQKVVMARSVQVRVPAGFSTGAALRELRHSYPECYVFAIARDEGCFVGATPERVVHQERGRVKVACMAGSTGRGGTDAHDRSLGDALLNDSKNVEEHMVVLRSILATLDPVCTDVQPAVRPAIRKFANVQHLYTPVTAQVAGEHDVLDIVSRVHPTPAIGGHPTADALRLIAEEEDMHRGWYAGPVGWLNAAGDGEFAVGLRSGLLRPGEAHLFAGCGIMGDSDAKSEYDESVLKLRPMMKALEAGVR